MTKPLDFQSIIMTLQHFWAEHGCLIWQPYYSQVGAGTLNPATALRVLGPEPWNVGYVEPSIRPADGRYGENPNRMQMFYQFQVILKPDPGNPQELYLQSLEALGIDPHQHDIRFVEDNWESPAIGAWGLGWEVWLDGQEITQFTYFQQSGGQMLDPVSVEITYGLERIAMTLQGGGDFRKILWNDTITDGDLNLQGEQEHSQYYFEVAEVERLRQMYDLFEAEAKTCIEHGLVLPAHDYVLKCSHTFNVLDSRGAIGVTERQAFFSRMRELARLVSVAYLEQRQRLEYPLMKDEASSVSLQPSAFSLQPLSIPHPSSFILEVGTEELPAGDLDAALEQLKASVPALLDELRLTHGEVQILGTPRRLVVYVENVASQQTDVEQVFRGPPADRAYDTLGQPTKAAEGFARGKGISVHDLQTRQTDGGRYVVAVVKQQGRMASEVLAESLPALIAGMRFDKSMRWNHTNVTFSRPIRWLMALLGEQAIPFEYAGLQSGNLTRGLRFTEPEEIAVTGPADYFAILTAQGILLDPLERQKIILQQVKTLAAEVGSQIPDDGAGVQALLAEVANLVEAPTALRGSFDPEHLKLPREVLVSVMKKHQRYFALTRSAGEGGGRRGEGDDGLLPNFITVANKPYEGPESSQAYPLIVEGNEHVIRARFADANFFVRDDLKHKLEDFLPRLGTLTFQLKLGSMLDKSRRIVELVGVLARQVGLSPQETAVAHRAAELCKADLASRMVVEMTSLQGLMGRYYALHSGEDEAVATAIFEHYLPRYPGDAAPQTKPGLVVSLADRLDTLAGLFAAGLAPSGAKDPFAQRRAAIGLAQTLITRDLDFDLRVALATAKDLLPIPMEDETQTACLDFIIERLRHYLLEQGGRYDVVDAIITAQGHNPAHSARAVQELAAWTSRPDWHTILPAYARCVRIVRSAAFQGSDAPYQVRSDNDPAETALYEALLVAEKVVQGTWEPDTFLNAFLPMIPAVNRFFDVVLVMAEDPVLRKNRLVLLQRIADLAKGVADLSKLEGF